MAAQNQEKFICCIVFILLIALLWCLCSGSREQYQAHNRAEFDKRDIQQKKYPFQAVSQDNIAAQRADYARTLYEPIQLAQAWQQNTDDDLLPIDKQSCEWARANPTGCGSLPLVRLLEAGQHIGTDTQGSSLKNANLQLRSEPANPIIPVSIFYNSSITPDIYRKQLEIGECS